MSIATTAPDKYAFQDLACIDLMLRFALAGSATFTIESGAEDADLIIGQGADAVRYEIQVKGAAGAVGTDELAKWLLHFPAYRDDDTALERLIADPRRLFVLVASGRCRDALAGLVAHDDWTGGPSGGATPAAVNEIRDAFGRADPDGAGETDLHRRRITHRDAVAARLKHRPVADALRRVIVIERATRPWLEQRICAALTRRGLPPDRCNAGVAVLRAVVDAARGTGEDALAPAETALRAVLPATLAPANYELRGDEVTLEAELTSANALLLSGVGRSGKTTTALWLGSRFETRGFEVRRLASVEAAEAFLDDPVRGARLAILDDPLGGAQPVPRPDDALLRLERLIGRRRSDRRLVVAQGRERLLEVTRELDVAAVLTGGRGWWDTSDAPLPFLAALWTGAAQRHGFPENLAVRVAAGLADGSVALGAGALDFLARAGGRLPANAGLEQAIRLARTDAKALGDALAGQARSLTLLPAMLLASDARAPLHPVELAFVQGAGGGTLPGLTTHFGTSFTLGGGRRGARPFPNYGSAPATDPATRSDLDVLERLHVAGQDGSGRLAFSHRFYREAVEASLRNPTAGAADALMEAHRRALFSRASATSRAAARNLDLLLHLMAGRPSGREAVFRRAAEGLGSYFPPTRDICFDFLVRHVAEAAVLTGAAVVDWLHRVTHVDLSELQWLGDEAVVPVDGEIDDEGAFSFLALTPRAAVASTLAALDGPGPLPPPRDAARALRHLRVRPGRMTAVQAGRLLSYEEGVIRGEAARCWLSEPRTGDAAILDRLLRDGNPLVAIGTYKGVLVSLAVCAAERRDTLGSLLARIAAGPVGALALMDRLIVFERQIHGHKAAAWTLFGHVMPAALRALPPQTRFDKARLANVMAHAARRLQPRRLAAIAREWSAWLGRASSAGVHLGSFATAIVPVLVEGTRAEPRARAGLLASILATRPTGALLPMIADAVDAWDELTADERTTLLEALRSGARDDRWRAATALTRRKVPLVVMAALLPAGTALTDAPARLAATVPGPLLEACLAVHCATPGRLHAVSTRDRSSPWEGVAALVATTGDWRLLRTIFGHVAEEEDEAAVAAVVAAAVPGDAEGTFELMMAETMLRDHAHLGEGWHLLLVHAPDASTRVRWLDEIASAASAIFEDRDDLDSLMRDPAQAQEILRRLPGDTSIEALATSLLQLGKASGRELLAKSFDLFRLILAKSPPKILGVVDAVFDALGRAFDLPADLKEDVQKVRVSIIEAAAPIRERWAPEVPIRDWVDPGPDAL